MSDFPDRCVLMGNPQFFRVKGGANPHTRTKFGLKKKVSAALAVEQWKGFATALYDRGVHVYVVPPVKNCPGLVYPANAGVLYPLNNISPPGEKTFYLSKLTPTRAAEEPYYFDFMSSMGFKTHKPQLSFEGEADFAPWKDLYVFTWGKIRKQRFVPRFAWPPIKRVYGFRSDKSNMNFLESLHGNGKVLSVELVLEEHYHGDTVLCSFGENRRFLLLYPQGVSPDSMEALKDAAEEDEIIELSEQDAKIFSANSFYVEQGGNRLLFMPVGVSDALVREVKDRGVEPVLVNVSEFLAKGGGSVKCMILDLGPDVIDNLSSEILEFRESVVFKP